jgi:hypothetical protein
MAMEVGCCGGVRGESRFVQFGGVGVAISRGRVYCGMRRGGKKLHGVEDEAIQVRWRWACG